MRLFLAKIFRLIFKIPFFKKRFFGVHKRIIAPLKLFKGVTTLVKFKKSILLELHIDDWIQENIYFLGEYENPELQFIQSSLKQGDIFIDIGANIGVHSLFASKLVGKEGHIIAFEPFSKNFKSLSKNISLNKSLNITKENLAICETDTFIDLFYNNDESNLGMVSSHISQYTTSEKIKAVSLDSYFNNKFPKKIDFIKIDIEGGEYSALLGMKKILTTFYPKLLIEILENETSTQSNNEHKIVTYLKSIGYEKYFIDDNGTLSSVEKNKERMNFAFIKATI
jgi:FkbM family methyltransferase